MDVTNTFTWESGDGEQFIMRWDISYDYDKDGDQDQVYTRFYFDNFDYDLSHIDNWYLLYEVNNLTGVGTAHYTCEYNEDGLTIKTTLDNGNFMTRSYYDSKNWKEDNWFSSTGAWQQSIVYYDEGFPVKMKQRYISDQDTSATGDVVFYEYDIQGRTVITRFDNNDFIVTNYYDAPSSNKKQDIYFGEGSVWKKTIEYFDSVPVMQHYLWGADTEVITFEEYDASGRLLRRNYNNGNVDVHEFYASGNAHFDVYFNSGNWLRSVEYFDAHGNVVSHVWAADTAALGEVTFEEYNAAGRILSRNYDNGDVEVHRYYETGNKNFDEYYNSGTWQRTVEYFDTASLTEYREWNADTAGANEVVFKEFNSSGNIVRLVYDNGDNMFTSYWADGYKEREQFANGDEWQKTIEYFDTSSNTIHFQWIKDSGAIDAVTFEEYNSSGQVVRKQLNTGVIIVTTYYEGTGNKQVDQYTSGGTWQKSVQYWDKAGEVKQFEWLADANPGVEGDIVQNNYDENGVLVSTIDDTGHQEIVGGIQSLVLNDPDNIAGLIDINSGTLNLPNGIGSSPNMSVNIKVTLKLSK